jgi:hypothetical protein
MSPTSTAPTGPRGTCAQPTPSFLDLSAASYATNADKWNSLWSCKILRTCGGALVALNVTKGATALPTMVKTSAIPLAESIPVSWDQTQPNTLATENILADMQGGIVDACPSAAT